MSKHLYTISQWSLIIINIVILAIAFVSIGKPWLLANVLTIVFIQFLWHKIVVEERETRTAQAWSELMRRTMLDNRTLTLEYLREQIEQLPMEGGQVMRTDVLRILR